MAQSRTYDPVTFWGVFFDRSLSGTSQLSRPIRRLFIKEEEEKKKSDPGAQYAKYLKICPKIIVGQLSLPSLRGR